MTFAGCFRMNLVFCFRTTEQPHKIDNYNEHKKVFTTLWLEFLKLKVCLTFCVSYVDFVIVMSVLKISVFFVLLLQQNINLCKHQHESKVVMKRG